MNLAVILRTRPRSYVSAFRMKGARKSLSKINPVTSTIQLRKQLEDGQQAC